MPELWDFIAWKIVGHWCVPKLYNYMAFQPFDFERTWWRLFWAYLMKVILSVPDEGYFEHTWWRLFWAYLMTVILSIPDEGYFERTWWRLFWVYLMKVILSIPDERLFQKNIMHTRFDIYVFIACFLMFTLIDFLLAIPDY